MIVASIAPAVLGGLADNVGRRAVYVSMMGVYCAANMGLALQSDWAAFFVLRMVQSAGSAATIAVGYGVVSDIAPPSERGSFVSGLLLGPNVATAIGPILGGALTDQLPRLALDLLAPVHPVRSLKSEEGVGDADDRAKRRLKLPNPLKSLRLLWAKDSALITLIFGVFYMNLSSLQASLSTLFVEIYSILGLQLGLVYLPSGVGSCIGAYFSGVAFPILLSTTLVVASRFTR
ncbi:hypothetical protein CMUS01_08444 [Colletotrichum musicola]|uniref:Major facilitator superfamily (MFS) profile domain-containing protein n=1 Tax=Colletotrichum musicola TaxID=2175873 RepID=A0A8H6KCU4_9PEZI|nr:hypothetical protein CMUS01_08444 [Colletotrichum musicola]